MKLASALILKIFESSNRIRKVLGFTDEVTQCGLCGKNPLKGTFAFEDESGEINYYGSECINKRFGVDDKKIKDICNKVEGEKDQTFLRKMMELESARLLNTILRKNIIRSRYSDEQLNKFIENYLKDRQELFTLHVQPYPNLRKKYEKDSKLNTKEDILKKINFVKQAYGSYKKDSDIVNSNNTVF